MSDNGRWDTSDILVSFVLGSLTGAALAILLAPQSGEETRYQLRKKLREGAKQGRKLRDRVVSESRHLIDEAGGYVEKGREALDTASGYLKRRR